MKSHHIEIYESYKTVRRADSLMAVPGWKWRHRAGNGEKLSSGAGCFERSRDLVRNLELAHPGHRMLRDDDGGWNLIGFWGNGGFLGTSVIPVRVPKGTEDRWASRRNRG